MFCKNKHRKDKYLQKQEKMLLCGQIKLKDIEHNFRIQNPSLYAFSFRYSRGKTESSDYISNLKIMKQDIDYCQNLEHKKVLNGMLNAYLELAPYQGDEEFENFRKIYL